MLKRIATIAAKAVSAMAHPGSPPFMLGHLKRTRYNYAKEIGDGIDASVVTAPVQFMQRAMPEARLVARRRDGNEIETHPAVALVSSPNRYFGDVHLWAATVLSYLVAGNAYWIKVRNGTGRPVELWPVPSWTMTPKWPADGSQFLTHYEYRPGSGAGIERLEFDDVVHFRHGVDPRNARLGLSPLHGVIREIFTDLESSNFVAALLKNMGVPGVVISPDGGAQPGPEDVAAVKEWFRSAFGGDNRGAPLVMGGATKVQQYGFTPQQMDLSVVRDVAEERVCASLGIPAAVVGFGAGLQTAKVGATMKELRQLAWANGIIPMLTVFADEINRSLMPDFDRGGTSAFVFDTSDVRALSEDQDKAFERWSRAVQGGWAMVAEAREAAGLDVDDSHRIYLRPFSAIEVPAGAAPRLPGEPKRIGAKHGPDDGHSHGGLPRASERAMRAGRGYVNALARAERPLAETAKKALQRVFRDLSKAAGTAALEAMPKGRRGTQDKSDDLLVLDMLERMGIAAYQAAFREVLEKHYLQVAQEVAKAGDLVGIATALPDPVARSVMAAGGRRAGLVDLSEQSKRALFDALAEGRAAGEGVEQLAARIASEVGAGPWMTAETRATIIARTETKFAQNASTLAIGRQAGAQRFIIFDGRLGPGRSVPEHIERDGGVVSAEEAAQMAADEHPNGTLSFAPEFEPEEDEQ